MNQTRYRESLIQKFKRYFLVGFPENTMLAMIVAAVAWHLVILYLICLIQIGAFVLKHRRVIRSGLLTKGFPALVIIAAATLILPITLSRDLNVLYHYLVLVLASLFSVALVRSKAVYYSASRFVLHIYQTVVIAAVIPRISDPLPLEELIPGKSQNGITSYLIVLQANYCVISYLYARGFPFITMLITMWICIHGYGRGSILASFLMIIASVIYSIKSNKSTRNMLLIGLITVIAMVLNFDSISELSIYLENETKLGAGLRDQSREVMNQEYISLLVSDPIRIFVGSDYYGTTIESLAAGNPHNSFIRAHHLFGLPYLLLVVSLPIIACWYKIKALISYSSILLLIMFSRALTEPIFFPTFLDVFVISAGLMNINSVAHDPEKICL
jgi:hypothetical protein